MSKLKIFSSDDIHDSLNFKLGSIVVIFQDITTISAKNVYLYYEQDFDRSVLRWEEDNQEKYIMNGHHNIPHAVLSSLAAKPFLLFYNKKSINLIDKSFTFNIYVDPASFITFQESCDIIKYHYKTAVQNVIQHFFEITVKTFSIKKFDEEALIKVLMNSVRNCFNPDVKAGDIIHPSLLPKLRDYQKQAINWMLKQEISKKEGFNQLYSSLKFCDGQQIYYHKYNGLFISNHVPSLPRIKGGILADEMGLGKTVEVIACILLNNRKITDQPTEQISGNNGAKRLLDSPCGTPASKRILQNLEEKSPNSEEPCKMLVTCTMDDNLTTPALKNYKFECVCGSTLPEKKTKTKISCTKCDLCQHQNCILSKDSMVSFSLENYICPYCWIKNMDIVKSRATLIITPQTICNQWAEEFQKHLTVNSLDVFIYKGVLHHKFVNPVVLANHDVILTTYETLQKELNHVTSPCGKYTDLDLAERPLRHPKKFRSIPSPLTTIEWWRICLDEAQMVESATSKSAKMVDQLSSIHRWCVTGTPIQKSISDLYGLLLFLRVEPFTIKKWWNDILFKPFINGESEGLISILNDVLWRTSKEKVLDQIGIPMTTTKVRHLQLSQIERVFYESISANCAEAFNDRFRTNNLHKEDRLNNLDSKTLSQILAPFKKLQKACGHFQITGGNFADVQQRKMTIPELLDHLLKTTSYDCEEIHRKIIFSLNGLGGIYTLKNEISTACEMYKGVLHSAKEHESQIRTDDLQLIHALFNYSKLLSEFPSQFEKENIIEKLGVHNIESACDEMNRRCESLCQNYVQKYKELPQHFNAVFRELETEIKNIISMMKSPNFSDNTSNSHKVNSSHVGHHLWWYSILKSLNEQETGILIASIKSNLEEHSTFSSTGSFTNDRGLLFKILVLTRQLEDLRKSLQDAMLVIINVPSNEDVWKAAQCHLRPCIGVKVSKCLYCTTDALFSEYETQLFQFMQQPDQETDEDSEICFTQGRRGTHADGDLEIILKAILNYARSIQGVKAHYEDGLKELKLFDLFKKEFKQLRTAWLKMSEYVNALDELEMTKMRLRLLEPGEPEPNPPVPHIISQSQVLSDELKLQNERFYNQEELKKKLGRLFYLQNLKKLENTSDPVEENCPICVQKLMNLWYVMQCGHNLCFLCMKQIRKNIHATSNIRCPICRETIPSSEIYLVESTDTALENNIEIQGRYSSKITDVTRCLLQIKNQDEKAKSLVFSTWPDLLRLLETALQMNGMCCLSLINKKDYQKNLDTFKKCETQNILLVPLNLGANGLNIIEANHVLILEPNLDNSKILQAIGRVHRIGQKRETTTHKFVTDDTIELSIFKLFEDGPGLEKTLTCGDIANILCGN